MPIISSWDKLTSKAKEALQAANYLASKQGNRELMPLHVLASLLSDREGMVVPVLSKIGVDGQAILTDVRRQIDCLPAVWAGGGRGGGRQGGERQHASVAEHAPRSRKR